MQTVNLDWSQLQVQGITDTLKKYGVTVTGVASAEYQVDKQIADIENTIQQHPDGIISIPVDFTATAPTYKKVVAGRHQARVHGQHPDRPEASGGICRDGLGRQPGQRPDRGADPRFLRARKGGTIGLVNFGVDYFSTNERTKGVGEWMKKNRPDIKMKQVDFTDPSKVSQIAGDFLTGNPDVKGLFAVWDQPALDTLSSMRAQGIDIPDDHGRSRPAIGDRDRQGRAAQGDRLAASLRPGRRRGDGDDECADRARTRPAWVGVQSLPVVQSNVLESFKTVFKKDPPAELIDACNKAKPACN